MGDIRVLRKSRQSGAASPSQHRILPKPKSRALLQPGIPVEATVRVKWAHHRMSMKATNVPACKPERYTCKPARRFAACIDLVHACSSACMRDKVRACMLIDMYACTRPMVVCTMQIHAYTRDVRVCGTMRWLPAPTSRFAPWACRLPEQCAGFNERPPCVHVSVLPRRPTGC